MPHAAARRGRIGRLKQPRHDAARRCGRIPGPELADPLHLRAQRPIEAMSAKTELIASADARIGMFVAELDRPWIGTPFLLQGFLIEDEATLAQLRTLCRFIYIDRSRSLNEHYAAAPDEDVASQVGKSVVARPLPDADDDPQRKKPGFLEIINLIRAGGLDADTARRIAGAAAREGEPTTVERELVLAAPTFEQTRAAFDQLLADVRRSRQADLKSVFGCVGEMTRSISRNPDALLWLIRLKRHDSYSYHHALDVTVYLMAFARSLGFTDENTTLLGVAGLMQDVGKLRLPERILRKEGRLSRLEMEIAKSHVEFSTQILGESSRPEPELIGIVQRHHERLDGSGYPGGLHGVQIGLQAEMAGLVDSFCAMISDRSYDGALSTQRALETLIRQRDVKFSAAVVDSFIQCIGLYPAGTLVELNSGEVGVVIAQNRVRRLLPRVLVLLSADKTPNRYPPTLDLLYSPLTPDGKPYSVVRALPAGAYGVDPAEYYLS
jgi:HD-GYP domain-containing protein (c-di-GMP phosphodiesterase class II)